MSNNMILVEIDQYLANQYLQIYHGGDGSMFSRAAVELADVIYSAIPKPKIEEPNYLGSVVTDGEKFWTRAIIDDDDDEFQWFCSGLGWDSWDSLPNDVRVVR